MIQSPIHKVLLTFQISNVQFLLRDGQACNLYGGAEFSRDINASRETPDYCSQDFAAGRCQSYFQDKHLQI